MKETFLLLAYIAIILSASGIFLSRFMPRRHGKQWAKIFGLVFVFAGFAAAYLLSDGAIFSLQQ